MVRASDGKLGKRLQGSGREQITLSKVSLQGEETSRLKYLPQKSDFGLLVSLDHRGCSYCL